MKSPSDDLIHRTKTFVRWAYTTNIPPEPVIIVRCECGTQYYFELNDPKHRVFETMITFDIPPCPNDANGK